MKKPLIRYKRFWVFIFLLLIVGYLLTLRPVQIILQSAPNKPSSHVAAPSIPASGFLEKRKLYLSQLERTIYGKFPDALSAVILSSTDIKPDEMANANIELFNLEIRNGHSNQSGNLDFIIVSPKNASPNTPLILTQNFCPNHNVVPDAAIPVPEGLRINCESEGFFSSLMYHFFGRYIVSPPFQDILSDGYAIGIMHPPQFVADNAAIARRQLDSYFSDFRPEDRPGALITWAALSTEVAKLMSDSYGTIITYGHSRYGKTALLAAAYSEFIDGAIAHQSGTAGASLFKGKPGETLKDIIKGYPHWLGANAADYADNPYDLPLDQHYLLALLAPKPVLLGNARRDVWSDPEGAFRSAIAASKTYEQAAGRGMSAKKLNDFIPSDDLSFWIRPGTHGVVEEDWPAFLKFLRAHFPAK